MDKGGRDRTGRPRRALHGFDSVRGRTVLFGGTTINGISLGDTWEWTGATWIQALEFGPLPRLGAAMSFDGTKNILFGGTFSLTGPQNRLGDTWSWDGRFWTQRQDIGPASRLNCAMAFDSTRKKTVLFGGTGTLKIDRSFSIFMYLQTGESAGSSGRR